MVIKNTNGSDISCSKLSLKELREFKGFTNIDESEANEIINSLYELAILVYNIND